MEPPTRVDAVVVQSFASQLEMDVPKHFWEEGFLGVVFGQTSVEELLVPGLERRGFKRPAPPLVHSVPKSAMQRVVHVPSGPMRCSRATLYAVVMTDRAPDDVKSRRVALANEWATLLCLDLEAWQLGRVLLKEQRALVRDDVVASLGDALARKATSTIAKRLGAISRFASWCTDQAISPFPLLEQIAYRYIKHLQANGSAPTAGKSFVEAVNFSVGMLGLQVDEVFRGSQRVKGAADALAANAPVVVQAVALTVAQVIKLEQFCCGDACLQDVCTVGGMLVLLYGCARVSDGQRARSGILDRPEPVHGRTDVGFFELEVVGSKTAYTLDKKRRILPVVAPLFSLSSCAALQLI